MPNTVRESHKEAAYRPHNHPQRTHTTDAVMDASPQGDIVTFEPTALDVLQVNNLISSFVQCLDNGDGRRLATLFAPGGTVNVSLCACMQMQGVLVCVTLLLHGAAAVAVTCCGCRLMFCVRGWGSCSSSCLF
jgi:hypothetical protein